MINEENQRLKRVNQCFLDFTTNPDKNIQLLTNCCGELMGAACALYNRLEDGMLHTLAQWNAPPDYNPVDRPDGHICHDVINTGGKAVYYVPNLPQTSYAKTDSNVSAYCLKTYIGAPVNCKNRCVGSLCVVYQTDYSPDEEEKKLLQILAVALGVEEERREEAVVLRTAKEDLEIRVAERTADLAKMNEQLLTVIDVRKEAERKLVQANAELKTRSEELLRTQEELVRQEKLAVLGKLSGSVGHELRNPLGVISNAIYFLRMVQVDADETVKEYLDMIKREIGNAEKIISDLLDFARIKPPRTQVIAARELIAEIAGKCPVPDNVIINLEIPEMLPPLRIDPHQIGQVFQNLIINAVQAMPNGGALRIAARHVQGSTLNVQSFEGKIVEPPSFSAAPDADYVEICVEDTGEGILPENMKKLFQPLFTTKPRGIGLGLPACRNLVMANGGRIAVESRTGDGTTFTVTLPAAETRT